jgi:hypothetical protein
MMKISEVVIDNEKGLASVPLNVDVDYFGLRVLMRPSTFLELSLPLPEDEDYEYLKNHIRQNKSIGAPWLDIRLPEEYENQKFTKIARVAGHEGRHRMAAIKMIEGDNPVETHLFFSGGWRNRDLTPEIIKSINTKLFSEYRVLMLGPFFTLK